MLVYSQQGGLGGSTRLLLNLARHLGRSHDVTVALGGSPSPQATRALLAHFGDLRVEPAQRERLTATSWDVALLHLPFRPDWSTDLAAPRKVAVIMELAGRHEPVITEALAAQFERILYLHPEQVTQLSGTTVVERCLRLPIINNIDFTPAFAKTRCVGTVGGAHKTGLASMLRLLEALPSPYRLRRWSPDRLTMGGLQPQVVQGTLGALGSGRLEDLPADADLRTVYAGFDALLHTPRHGNGTSVVVSDALQCGKLALLAPLAAYREAYGHLPGVLFTDRPADELARRLCDYSETEFNMIRKGYGNHYDRTAALEQWSQALAG